MNTKTERTRFWSSPDTTTCIQFRTDTDPKVWIHTNLGWVPIGNTPDDAGAAEAFAVDVAAGYKLEEASEDTARYMAGWE